MLALQLSPLLPLINLSPQLLPLLLLIPDPLSSPILSPLTPSLRPIDRSLANDPSLLTGDPSPLLLIWAPLVLSWLLFFVGFESLTNCSTIVWCPTNPISSATLISSPSSSPHGYRIFVPCSITNWVFIYSSANQSWSRFSGLDSVMGHSNSHQNGILFRGSLFFSTPEPFLFVGFDPVIGVWDPRAGPKLPAELAFVCLVNGRIGKEERLYLVGGVGRDGISRSLRIWELVSGSWEEVGRLPELTCRKFVSVCCRSLRSSNLDSSVLVTIVIS